MRIVEHVVTNRVFLIGLDQLYREIMGKHESTELLACAREVAHALHVDPAHVPVEGYYTDAPELTSYFLFMRALQNESLGRGPEVDSLPAFRRLLEVTSSPLYGRPKRERLLPAGIDPLTAALEAPDVPWSVTLLSQKAAEIARLTDDCSLIGLAARSGDPVVLAALRESVVLYASRAIFDREPEPERHIYVWQVDPELSAAAGRFVQVFNQLIEEALPFPTPAAAETYGKVADSADLNGRCVNLGTDPGRSQPFYHWALCEDRAGRLAVVDFWDDELWTTERFLSSDESPRLTANT